jgi:hypothetical protein
MEKHPILEAQGQLYLYLTLRTHYNEPNSFVVFPSTIVAVRFPERLITRQVLDDPVLWGVTKLHFLRAVRGWVKQPVQQEGTLTLLITRLFDVITDLTLTDGDNVVLTFFFSYFFACFLAYLFIYLFTFLSTDLLIYLLVTFFFVCCFLAYLFTFLLPSLFTYMLTYLYICILLY